MNQQILTGTELSTGRRLPRALIAEYEDKRAKLDDALSAFADSQTAIKMACAIGGTFANDRLETGRITKSDAERFLLKSAWRHFYDECRLGQIMPAARDGYVKADPTHRATVTAKDAAYLCRTWHSMGLAEALAKGVI